MPTKRSIIYLHNRSDLAVITLHLTFRTWCAFYYSDRSPTHAHSRLHLNFRTCTAHSRAISQATTPTNSPPFNPSVHLRNKLCKESDPNRRHHHRRYFFLPCPGCSKCTNASCMECLDPRPLTTHQSLDMEKYKSPSEPFRATGCLDLTDRTVQVQRGRSEYWSWRVKPKELLLYRNVTPWRHLWNVSSAMGCRRCR